VSPILRPLFFWRSQGQTTVELAMVATVLFVLLFAIIEMGLVIYRYNMICSAAREAVRYAIVKPSDTTGIKQQAINSAPFLSAGDITVTFPADTKPGLNSRNDARVAISYSYSLRIPLLPLPSSVSDLTLSSSSQMLCSNTCP
jgi:Flp pilus assembly protein TadG